MISLSEVFKFEGQFKDFRKGISWMFGCNDTQTRID
jgi:hypothetical protein